MKNIFRYILYIGAALGLLVSCNTQEEPEVQGEEIHFTASVGTFQVRATDTAFEEGDEIALACAYSPAITTKLVFNGSSLVPETPVFWPAEASENTHVPFYAVYPYQENANLREGIEFSVKEDQSTHANFTASDLMVSIVSPAPKDGNTIHLPFVHKLTNLIMKIENKGADSPVSEVYLSNICGKTIASEDSWVYSTEEYQEELISIKAAKVLTADGTEAWTLILPSQYAQPIVTVVTADGESLAYQVPDYIYFESGRRYTASVVLQKGTVSADFTTDITDWVEDELDFGGSIGGGDTEPAVWSVYYYSNPDESDWGDFDMDPLEDGTFHARINYIGDEFAIRRNHSWDYYYCNAVPEYFPKLKLGEPFEMTVFPTGDYYIAFSSYGELDLVFSPSTGKLTTTLVSELSDWRSMGQAMMLDGLLGGEFEGVADAEYPVTVEINRDETKLRIRNPFVNSPYYDAFDHSEEEGCLIFDISNFGQVYLERSFTGLIDPDDKIEISYESLVPENGWENYSYYGYIDDDGGYLHFDAPIALLYGDYAFSANRRGYFTITMEGRQRPFTFSDMGLWYQDEIVQTEDGLYAASFQISRGFDDQRVRYILYNGNLSREEILSQGIADMNNNVPEINYVDLPDDGVHELLVPISHGGTYTIFAYADNYHNDTYYWRFASFTCTLPGEEVPDFEMTMTAAPFTPLPESAIEYHINFPAIDTLKTLVVPKDTLLEKGIGPDSYLDLVLEQGSIQNNYYFDGINGTTYREAYLNPQTEYVVIAGGCDAYGNYGVVSAEVSTGAEPTSWNEAGTGTWFDITGIAYDSYSDHPSDTLLQAVPFWTTREAPGRYRVGGPYKEFWAGATEQFKAEYYTGESCDHFDVFFQEHNGNEYIYFTEIHSGWKHPQLVDELDPLQGEAIISHRALYWVFPAFSSYTERCVKVDEGIYQIAPYVLLYNTGYVFNWTNYDGLIYLILPGYELPVIQDEPVAGGTSLRKARRTNAPELDSAPLFSRSMKNVTVPAHRRIRPAGAPVVKAAPLNNVINERIEL